MARMNVLDAPLIEALREVGEQGALAEELAARVAGTGTKWGVQFALKRMIDGGAIARKFEWTFHDNGKPRARVYRYFTKDSAPEGSEMV